MVMVDLASDHRQIAQQILFFPTEERTARELEQLPKEAREQVWADMTGHPESIDYRIQAEDPAFLHLRFQDLAKELECRSCKRDAAAYRMAVQHDADYVNQQKLKFLRADNFESAAAAIRMIAHYQMKMDLFGSENLGRDIRLDDLSPDDLESLRAGGMQLLPLQDHAGRGVLFSRHANYVYKDHKNLLRSFFYIGQIAAENETFQKLGFISVSYQVGNYPKQGYDFELTRKVSTLVRGSAIRFVAIYVCYSYSPWKSVADLISHLVEPLLRVRLRSVTGSHQECLYKLLTLGIPHHCFPITNDGESLLSNHWKWLEERQRIEHG